MKDAMKSKSMKAPPAEAPTKQLIPTIDVPVMIGAICVWCAAGLVALDSARILPSPLSPFLLDAAFATPVKFMTVTVLLIAAPITHFLGRASIENYKLWQPFRGGSRFIYAQCLGWSFYSMGLVLLAWDLSLRVFGSSSCLTCAPGFLIGLAALALIGNAVLIKSLYEFDSSDNLSPREATIMRAKRHLTGCAISALTAAVALSALLARHPMLAPYLVESTQFGENGIDLPFCELPFFYSSYIAQPVSAVAHLPYVPIALLSTAHGLSPTHKRLLAAQTVLQLWTTAGHVVANPRTIKVQELSILIIAYIAIQFVHATSRTFPRTLMLKVLGVFGLTLTWYLSFGLMSAIVAGLTAIFVSVASGAATGLCSEVSPFAVQALKWSTPAVFAILIGEVAACDKLLAFAKISWHLPFDVVFWQCWWPLLDAIAIAKPGSLFKNGAPPDAVTAGAAANDAAPVDGGKAKGGHANAFAKADGFVQSTAIKAE